MDLDKKKDILATYLGVNRNDLDTVPSFYVLAFHQLFMDMAYLQEQFFDGDEDTMNEPQTFEFQA